MMNKPAYFLDCTQDFKAVDLLPRRG